MQRWRTRRVNTIRAPATALESQVLGQLQAPFGVPLLRPPMVFSALTGRQISSLVRNDGLQRGFTGEAMHMCVQ